MPQNLTTPQIAADLAEAPSTLPLEAPDAPDKEGMVSLHVFTRSAWQEDATLLNLSSASVSADLHGALTVVLSTRLPLDRTSPTLLEQLLRSGTVENLVFAYYSESGTLLRSEVVPIGNAKSSYSRPMPPQPSPSSAYVETVTYTINVR